MGGSDQWKLQRAKWAGARERITPDLPGFGSNAALQAPDTIGAYARSVLAKLDHQGVRSFELLGHSMGGMIVQEMIAIAPKASKQGRTTRLYQGQANLLETSKASITRQHPCQSQP